MNRINLKRLDLLDEPSPFQNVEAYEQKNHNWAVLRNAWPSITREVEDALNNYDVRMSNLIHSVAQPSEVVDARVDAYGKQYSVLKERLDADQIASVTTIDLADLGLPDKAIDVSEILKVTDLTTTSQKMSYSVIGPTTVTLPTCGYDETTIDQIEVDAG